MVTQNIPINVGVSNQKISFDYSNSCLKEACLMCCLILSISNFFAFQLTNQKRQYGSAPLS